MLNQVILVGRLGKDPETTQTQTGTAICKFSLATSEVYYDKNTNEKKETTEWHNIVVWGKQADSCGRYLSKGKLALIEGKITSRSWDDQATGQKRYMTEIKASRVLFLSGGDGQRGGNGGNGQGGGGQGGGGNSSGQRSGGQGGGGYDGPPADDDIPF